MVAELSDLFRMGIQLEIPVSVGLTAQFQVKSLLVEEIKTAQDQDAKFIKWKDDAQAGKLPGFTVTDGMLKCGNRLCVPDVGDLRHRILQEIHNAPYSVHPGTTKMYHDVKGVYWWPGMKNDVATFVSSCLTC